MFRSIKNFGKVFAIVKVAVHTSQLSYFCSLQTYTLKLTKAIGCRPQEARYVSLFYRCRVCPLPLKLFFTRCRYLNAVSILGWILIAILALAEVRNYMTPKFKEHMIVDTSLGQQLRINVNITFHSLTCNEVIKRFLFAVVNILIAYSQCVGAFGCHGRGR